MIDDIDRKTLTIIQENARTPRLPGKSAWHLGAVLERIRKLEERGLIQGYAAQLNARDLELGLLAFVFVRTDDRVGQGNTAAKLASIPEVQEVHHIAGEDCYLPKVRTLDTEALGQLLRERLGEIKSVVSTRTMIVLKTIKETTALPLEKPKEAKKRGHG